MFPHTAEMATNGKKICAKFILANYTEEDEEAIECYLRDNDKEKDGFLDTRQNTVFIRDSFNRCIQLNSGIDTLADKMGLTGKLTRIKMAGLPDSLFQRYTADQLEKNCKFYGMLTKELAKQTCRTVVACHKNRAVIDCLEKEGAVAMMRKGVVHPTQLSAMMHAEQVMKSISQDEEDRKKDLITGAKLRHVFANGREVCIEVKGGTDSLDECGELVMTQIDAVCPEFSFKMTQSELNENNKLKHYYIYSTSSDVGKSTFMKKMQKYLNCTTVNDFSNWVGMKAHAQFILADEVEPERRMTLADLKTLTGGDASNFAGRRKSHGASFVPRADAHVVFFSNHHLFEVYGRWSSKLGCRLINPSVAANLRARLHVIKLDESDGKTEADDAAFYTKEVVPPVAM